MAENEQRPVVIVIGGPNGAGKSTAAATVFPDEYLVRRFVNADTIATGLAGFAPESVALQAGRIMLARLQELAEAHQDFAFETTLSSRSFAPFIRRLREEGYHFQLIYVWLREPELAVQRVAERVRRGGHHVPEEDIRRRYLRGMQNFSNLYRPLADSWLLCDNSGDQRVIIAQGGRDITTEVLDEDLYEQFERAQKQ